MLVACTCASDSAEADGLPEAEIQEVEFQIVPMNLSDMLSLCLTVDGKGKPRILRIISANEIISVCFEISQGAPFPLSKNEVDQLFSAALTKIADYSIVYATVQSMAAKDPEKASQLKNLTKLAEVMTLSDLFMQLSYFPTDEDQPVEREYSYVIYYALVNNIAIAQDQLKTLPKLQGDPLSNFQRLMSKYSKVQEMRGTQYTLEKDFGSEIASVISNLEPGGYVCQPIPKLGKSIAVYLKDKRHAPRSKLDTRLDFIRQARNDLVRDRVSDLNQSGELVLKKTVNKLWDEISGAKVAVDSDPVAIIGDKEINLAYIKTVFEMLRPGISANEFFAQNKKQNPKYGREVVATLLNHLIRIFIEAREYELSGTDKNKDLYDVYFNQKIARMSEILFREWIRESITQEMRQERYVAILNNPDMADTLADPVKIKGLYLAVESPEILDTIKASILKLMNSEAPWDEVVKFFETLALDYSIYVQNGQVGDIKFDDRKYKAIKQFGNMQNILKGTGIEARSIYSSSVGPDTSKLYFLVCVNEVYKQDVSLYEVLPEIDKILFEEKKSDLLARTVTDVKWQYKDDKQEAVNAPNPPNTTEASLVT